MKKTNQNFKMPKSVKRMRYTHSMNLMFAHAIVDGARVLEKKKKGKEQETEV